MCSIVDESQARTDAVTFTRLIDASSNYLRNAIRTLDPDHARECCSDIKRLVGDVELKLTQAFPVSFDPISMGM